MHQNPSGRSSNGGTSFSDALDLKTALGKVSSDQNLYLEADTYKITYSSGKRSTLFLTKSGSSSNPILIEGYNGQTKLDFQCPEGKWVQDAWRNYDYGYDTFGSNYTVIFEYCTANKNGTHDGNGNGFKLGGNGVTAVQYLTNCVANNNRKHGFHANGNPGPIYLTNCSASGNGGNNYNGDFVRN